MFVVLKRIEGRGGKKISHPVSRPTKKRSLTQINQAALIDPFFPFLCSAQGNKIRLHPLQRAIQLDSIKAVHSKVCELS